MTAPTYKCEVAFTTDPLSSSPSYTDVTAYLRGFQIRRGRTQELDRTQAGEATIRLANNDRRFDPTYGEQNLLRTNQRNVESVLDADDFGAVAGATFARTTTAGQFNEGLAGLSVTAHATNANSGVSVGNSSTTVGVVVIPEPSTTYSVSVYVKGLAASTWFLRITYLDATGAVMSSTDGSNQVANTSNFVRYTRGALTPPDGSKYARIQVLFPAAGAGQTLYLDQFQYERAFNASDWVGAAPYYPNVVPMRRIRLTMTHNAVDYRLFTGFVDDWGQSYGGRPIQAAGSSEVTVQASDAFKLLSLVDMTPYQDEVIADEPVAYWPMDDPANTLTAHDEVGEHAGTYISPLTTASGPLVGGTLATDFNATNRLDVEMGALVDEDSLTFTGDFSAEFWVYRDTAGSTMNIIRCADDTESPVYYQIYLTPGPSPDLMTFYVQGALTTNQVQSNVTWGTGVWNHCVITLKGTTARIYKDGVDVTAGTGASLPNTINTNARIRIGGLPGPAGMLDGRLAHFALYDYALTPERVATHYARTFGNQAANVKTGTVIANALTAIGWPGAERTLSVGKSFVGMHAPSGNLLDYLLQLGEDTERGLLFVAGDGKITFLDRDDLLGDTVYDADFGDGTFGTTSEINYEDVELNYDDQNLFSTVTVTRVNGGSPAIAKSTAAAARYGPRTLTLPDTLLGTDNELADVANYVLSRFKDPHLRIEAMTLVGANNNFHLNEIHNRQLGDRVTVERRPPGTGLISRAVEVIGIDYDMPTVGTIRATFRLAPVRNFPQFWLLGHASYGILDSTTTLGF